ncbi:MAG: hypothetical protein PHE03_10360 [Bacteroidales bacterium]|nr:hypothetical protein [Bacteroidales bacterium]MDD3892688.1 hypothetical protein [Bacteroidales bacterium]
MLDRVKNIGVVRGSSVLGVQVSYYTSSSFRVHIIKTVKQRKNIIVEQQQIDVDSISALKPLLWKNAPVVVCVDGKSLVHKFVSEGVGKKPLDLVLPNAIADDFYVQCTSVDGGNFISVVRREIIDNLYKAFGEIGVIPVSMYFGPFSLNSTPFLFDQPINFATEFWAINSNSYSIEFTPTKSISHDFINISGDNIRTCLVPVLSISVAYIAKIELPIVDVANRYADEFLFKRAVWLMGWALLVFTFVLLLGNFMLFSYYNDKHQHSSTLLQQHQSLLNRNEALKEQYAKRRRFIERSGLLQSSRFSYFFDRIARIVPDSLELTSLSIASPDDKIRLGKPIKYNENQILVSGSSRGSSHFNNWKDKLKKEAWLKDIFIIKFGQEEPNKPIYFELLLEINR